ncbi:MAG: sugar transferase [Amaricoccus sp.]|uniref:sugar transferase n=1 Tax=Amaricoccus sp. TaxID=1872485 RepID=UPI0039E30EB7
MIAIADDLDPVAKPAAGLLSQSVRAPLKRAIDIAVSLGFVAVLAVVLPVLATALWLCHGVDPFYGHERVGRGGRRFRCWKLRTMAPDADARLAALLATSPAAAREWAETRKLRTDPRILGRIGRFLRRSSLDELPQFWNVLAGDMSLVGPRPVVSDELGHYGAHVDWYLAVRPGLTGPWQVGGRSEASYASRVRLDVGYARGPSLRRDAAILVRTLAVPFEQRGAC